MKPEGSRYLKWACLTYFVLMVPIAAIVVLIAWQKHPELTVVEVIQLAGAALIWPIQIPIAFAAMWYMGAYLLFGLWKWLELIQSILGIPLGRRMGAALARDRFLKNSPPDGPYGWLYKKVTQAYPMNLAGDLHV